MALGSRWTGTEFNCKVIHLAEGEIEEWGFETCLTLLLCS